MAVKKTKTLTALSAPEAEVVALSEALMPAVVIHESCRDIGLEVGLSPQVLFVVKTDSQMTLTQLRNESVTTRSRPFANKFNKKCGIGSDTPVGKGGTLDLNTCTIVGATAPSKPFILAPGVPPPPEYLPSRRLDSEEHNYSTLT